MPLSNAWRSSFPNARFAAPDAPLHHWRGHQWFLIEGDPLDPARIRAARKTFDDLMTDVVHREGFNEAHHRVAFVGVSQGAIVALDAIASGRWQIGALVSFAGLLAPQQVSPLSKTTQVLLVHGQADTIIPAADSMMAASQFQAAGFEVELDVEPGVGHTISSSGADRARAFLRRSLIS
ncbi:alpha/beta hydrolase [Agrobacterium larrymoorei]|nr:dienelactone hydrolase family protein [Agrobacterium larrymoorei]